MHHVTRLQSSRAQRKFRSLVISMKNIFLLTSLDCFPLYDIFLMATTSEVLTSHACKKQIKKAFIVSGLSQLKTKQHIYFRLKLFFECQPFFSLNSWKKMSKCCR